MKAAFLIRCSTDKQDYERQINDLTKVAEEFHYELPSPTLIFGEHITGKDDTTRGDRRSIRKLFKAVAAKEFDVLLINEVSRLSRDSVSGRVYVRKLNNERIPTYFRDKGRWTIDPVSKKVDSAFEGELGTYFDGAAEYLKSMKTQVASGRRARLRANQMIQRVPLGYKKQGGNGRWTKNTVLVDEEGAEIVRFVFDYYLKEGSTLKKTALAAEAKFNMGFSVGKVNHILNYKGYYLGYTTVTTTDPDSGKKETFKIEYPPILSEELYESAQNKLRSNRNTPKIRNAEQKIHLLSKLIKCPFCGHSFTPQRRADKRQAFTWRCMSRINNANPTCKSTINLNDDKIVCLIWEFLKKELINLDSYNEDEREEKVNEEELKIAEAREDLKSLEKQSERIKKQIENAYQGYIAMQSTLSPEMALDMFQKSVKELNEKNDDVNHQIKNLKQEIVFSERKIERFKGTDFSKDYLESLESDFDHKREIIVKYIKAIYPYKVGYRVFVLEILTTDNDNYFILFDCNQRTKQIATYIRRSFAYFQDSERRCQTYEKGNYFYVPNASLIMDTESLEEFLTFDEMDKVCRENYWELDYSNYPNNINKNFVSNIAKYNERKKKLLEGIIED